ncbi:MAG: serine protease [Candidatus Hydrogenedentota bacterium]
MIGRRIPLGIGMAAILAVVPAFAATPLLKEIEAAFVRIGEDVRPSVVNIDVETTSDGEAAANRQQEFEDLFRHFGLEAPEGPMIPEPGSASGSGFIYDTSGHIITNDHVVRDASVIKVRLWNGEVFDAKRVGTDPDTDVAVIKIEPNGTELRPAIIGDSNSLHIGQFAIAIGSPRGLEGSFSFGHVTGLSRQGLQLPENLRFQDFIQTDAAINLGNSGGPLCDIDGRVIGINTAIVYGADSLGFAVPINMAKDVIPSLIANGKVSRGFLGVNMSDVEQAVQRPENVSLEDVLEALKLPDKNGAYVQEVIPESPAAKADIQQDDIIRKVNDQSVAGAADLQKKIAAIPPGTATRIEVWRNGAPLQLEVKLEEYAGNVRLARAGKPVLGMRFQELSQEMAKRVGLEEGETGLLVIDVEEGSPAATGEITAGDIITKISDQAVTTVEQFRKQVNELGEPGKSLFLRVTRAGGRSVPKVILMPEAQSE